MARLMVVSNRVAVPGVGDVTRAGGLEVALRAVSREGERLWFGWSGRIVDEEAVQTSTISTDGQTYVVMDLSQEDFQEYYNGFANRVLWPILHYRLDLAEYSLRDLTGFYRVNQLFADEIAKILRPDDLIWVHDYHLIPLAKALRDKNCSNKIGFFLHTPMPPAEILTALPRHEQLFPLLCHYDLLGFQTDTDSMNFARYLVNQCKLPSRDLRSFLFDGTTVQLAVFPVGVDVDEIQQWAGQKQPAIVERVSNSLAGRTMIIGVDRLDYSKGIAPRMEAFERMLVIAPAWRGHVTYLQITPKSRQNVKRYADIEKDISALVGRVNGRHGEADWTPIRYINRSYGRATLAGLYRRAKVGLVTPLRDGMNLVAKEYIAAQSAEDPGVLVLSRFAGAAAECEGALLVNPHDVEEMAEAIVKALSMPLAERKQRYQINLQQLRKNDSAAWGQKFLDALASGDREMSSFWQASMAH